MTKLYHFRWTNRHGRFDVLGPLAFRLAAFLRPRRRYACSPRCSRLYSSQAASASSAVSYRTTLQSGAEPSTGPVMAILVGSLGK